MNKYIIGIDGGASKTTGVLVDDCGNTIGHSKQVGTNLSINFESVPGIILGLIKEICLKE